MKRIAEVLAWFRTNPVRVRESELESHQESIVADPASTDEVRAAWPTRVLPADAEVFWSHCRSARLFVDVEAGQWGLELLDPAASANSTTREHELQPENVRASDVVIGEFLGDCDLLVLAPSELGNRQVLVAAEMEPREEWYGVGHDLAEFLTRYATALGEKYWEAERIAEQQREHDN